MYETIDAESGFPDSHHGESDDGQVRDERELYGTPCHEVDAGRDEQTLYGEPQHETHENSDLPDLELLFVRMQDESVASPAGTTPGASPAVGTTER